MKKIVLVLLFLLIHVCVGMTVIKAQTRKVSKQSSGVEKYIAVKSTSIAKPFLFKQIKMNTTIQTFKAGLIKKGFKYKCGNEEDDYPEYVFVGKIKNIDVEILVQCGYQGKYVWSIIYIEKGYATYQEAELRRKQILKTIRDENGHELGVCPENKELLLWKRGALKFNVTKIYRDRSEYQVAAYITDRYSYAEYLGQAFGKPAERVGDVKNRKKEYINVLDAAERILSQKSVDMGYGVLNGIGFSLDNTMRLEHYFTKETKDCDFVSASIIPFDSKAGKLSEVKRIEFRISDDHMPDLRKKMLARGYRLISQSDRTGYVNFRIFKEKEGISDSVSLFQKGNVFAILDPTSKSFYIKPKEVNRGGIDDFNVIDFADSMFRINDFKKVVDVIGNDEYASFGKIESDDQHYVGKRTKGHEEQLSICRVNDGASENLEVDVVLNDWIIDEAIFESLLALKYDVNGSAQKVTVGGKEILKYRFWHQSKGYYVQLDAPLDYKQPLCLKFRYPSLLDEDVDIYSFCEGLYKVGDETQIDNTLQKKKWRFSYEVSKKKNYESADRKYRIETKKRKKKDTNVEEVELKFDGSQSDEVFKAIEGLGYKSVRKDLNVPSTYGESRNYQYDWYKYSNDEGYEIHLSVFTYSRDRVSYYVTFKKR